MNTEELELRIRKCQDEMVRTFSQYYWESLYSSVQSSSWELVEDASDFRDMFLQFDYISIEL